jgi:hypothetical protein
MNLYLRTMRAARVCRKIEVMKPRSIAIFAILLPAAFCQTPITLHVEGLSGSAAGFSLAELSALPQQTVKTRDHGTPVTFEGVLLIDVLAKVHTPVGQDYNKTVASYYVLADANDAYHAVFSWAEVDPTFTDRRIYVVTKRDGKPLSEKEGPLELVVPDDKRPSRWVHQLRSLKVEAEPTSDAYGSAQAIWIAASLKEMQTITVGLTRRDLLKVFMEEGGISFQTQRRYVYRKCGYIKVDVEFAPSGKPSDPSSDDRITKISKPFLEFAIMD